MSTDIRPVYTALMIWPSNSDIESSGDRVAAMTRLVKGKFRFIFKGQPSNKLKVMSSRR
jgi:hypothetical protein